MTNYNEIASDEKIEKVIKALKDNNIGAEVADDLASAKQLVLGKIPKGTRVFTATSVTLKEAGLEETLNSEPYISVRDTFMQFYGQPEKALEMKQLGSASDVSVGSVHAVTEDGKLLIASRTGSQIPNAVYGAAKVIFVVGAQKIVSDLNDGLRRIHEHTVPLEDVRSQEAYGQGTKFNKLLVINSEDDLERISVIIVKQHVGF
jgi:L-lactate utilization protein LutC